MAPAAASRLHQALDAAVAAERLLTDALRPFIERELARALGADMVAHFAPPADARAAALLRFMRSKWLGVFADSSAGRAAHLVDAALDALLAHARASTEAAEIASAADVAAASEGLLLALGLRGAAARVAEACALASGAPPAPAKPAEPVAAGDGAATMMMMDVDSETPSPDAAAEAPPPVLMLPPVCGDRMPVVLDGSNLAWAHGLSARFSMAGAALAFLFFRARGHPVALVLPEARVRVPAAARGGDAERRAVQWVRALRGTDALVLTPDADYDDAYITHLARRVGAVVVSNDRFEDQVYQAGAHGRAEASAWREWIAACRLSFAFQGDLFVPNPTFDFRRAAHTARRLALPPD